MMKISQNLTALIYSENKVYGYREIGGDCVDCATHEEALEIAITYAEVSGLRYRVYGEHIQHYQNKNVAREHQYCWYVKALGEAIGNQGTKGIARSNGRSIPTSEGSKS